MGLRLNPTKLTTRSHGSTVHTRRLRPVQASDAHNIARLSQLTSEGMANYIWSKLAASGEVLLSVGASRSCWEQGDFS